MFSGLRRLGESQDPEEVAPDSDLQEVSENFLSPDSGYPHQRIGVYDIELAEHQTLNDEGLGAWGDMFRATALPVSKLPAPDRREFVPRMFEPMRRTMFGMPRNDGGKLFMTPRTVDHPPLDMLPWGQTPRWEQQMAMKKEAIVEKRLPEGFRPFGRVPEGKHLPEGFAFGHRHVAPPPQQAGFFQRLFGGIQRAAPQPRPVLAPRGRSFAALTMPYLHR